MRLFEIKPDKYAILGDIRKNCSKILNLYKQANRVFYRGVEEMGEQPLKFHPKENRYTEKEPSIHYLLIDKWLESHGFKALRRNSSFMTGDVGFAADFGDPAVCFPYDGGNYTWSTEIRDYVDFSGPYSVHRDLYWAGKDKAENIFTLERLQQQKPKEYEASVKMVDVEMKKSDFHNEFPSVAILKSGNEVLFRGHYWVVPRTYPGLKELLGRIPY